MKYSKIQKFISYLLLFVFFLNISVNIPSITSLVLAKETSFYKLVSIIVDEKTYSEIKNELNRYWEDISSNLENTKVVILPVPKDASTFSIASMNEALFFDGYKSLSPVDFESKLISTVFVWDINIPRVYKWEDFSRTVLPYVDFEDKAYIFNKEKNRYEENKKSISNKAEIEFSFITPNTWDFKEDINLLKKYFKKNHDFYTWNWIYKQTDKIINWNKNEELDHLNYKPFVFYYDYIRESKSFNPSNYSAYLATRAKNEDLSYARYTKDLLNFLSSASKLKSDNDLLSIAKTLDPNIKIPDNSFSTKDVYDIQTKVPTEQLKKNFIDSFWKWSLWDLRKDVFNAWRYNFWQDVNVDFMSHIISNLDIISDEILKSENNKLEWIVDNYVESMSRKIAIPVSYTMIWKSVYPEDDIYWNYLFWKKADSINSASSCSIYRWSTQTVESNRAYNLKLLESDINRVKSMWVSCLNWINENWNWLNWLWWKNSPLYLKKQFNWWKLDLISPTDKKWAIEDLFDINWSVSVDNKNSSNPLQCFDNNYLLELKTWLSDKWNPRTIYKMKSTAWSCSTDSNDGKTLSFSDNYIEKPSSKSTRTNCDINIHLDWKLVKSYPWFFPRKKDSTDENCRITYTYKTIDSVIKHKEPTPENIASQSKNLLSPNLPIDKNRYIDFIRSDWKYVKIYYPNLFWVKSDSNLEDSKKKLETYYDLYKKDFDKIVNLESQGIIDDEIKKHPYYSNILDIIWKKDPISLMLKKKDYDKSMKTSFNTYWDELIFAVFWNNLSVSDKYSFVFDNYIWTKKSYFLPKVRDQYEISYLWANWNAQNMMVWLLPELKEKNPYSDIISRNQDLSSKIFWANISKSYDFSLKWNSPFKCAPPDGVPIWEWPSAISCWISDMLPPKINISEWTCSASKLKINFWNENKWSKFWICLSDDNKDWISDCLEKVNVLKISSNSNTYSYNSNVYLKAEFFQWDEKASFANNIPVSFEIIKIEKARNDKNDISANNKEVVFDIENPKLNDENIIKDYIDFSKSRQYSSLWEANYWFSTKNKELNVYLRANWEIKSYLDSQNTNKLVSNNIRIEVRWNTFISSSYNYNKKLNKFVSSFDNVTASDKSNIYIVDLFSKNFEEIKDKVNNFVESEDNLIIWLNNFSKSKDILPLKYPINIKLFEKDNVIQDLDIKSRQDFVKMSKLSNTWDYTLQITDWTWKITTRQITVKSLDAIKFDLKLWSNLILSSWSTTTNLLTIYDKFDNPVVAKNYLIDLEIEWKSILFVNNDWTTTNKISSNIFEWFKAFRIKSTDEIWKSNIVIKVTDLDKNKVIINSNKSINTIKDASLLISSSDLSVWWNNSKIKVSVLDSAWKIISWLNSRVYLKWSSNYFETKKSYFDVVNWESEIDIITKNLAWQNIPVEFQVEGISKIFNNSITIKPDLPIKVDVIIWNSKLEANKDSFTNVYLELKDRYNNTVFTDSTTKPLVEAYQNKLKIWELSQFKNWTTSFRVYSTDTPWVWYFKVSLDNDLSKNSFIVKDELKEIKINWYSENIWKIEKLYFFNKNKIKNNWYNSIYSVLLWSNYWDIEEKDYLAWAMIFDDNSRALAVTSLISSWESKNNIFSINKFWNIKELFASSDLSQNLETNVWIDWSKLYFDIYNKSLNTNIWKVYYNINNLKLDVCSLDFENCIDKKESSISWLSQNSSYKFYNTSWKLILSDNSWNSIFYVNSNWNFFKLSDVSFEISKSSKKYLILDVKRRNQIIWKIALNITDSEVNVSKSIDIFNTKKSNSKNNILLNLDSNLYSTYNSWEELVVYYNDPFSSKSSLDKFSNYNYSWFENFTNKSWIWWKWDNKTLLSFSSWRTVWESVKDYMWFYTINIWDPFISLKQQKKTFNWTKDFKQFDSTIWDIIAKWDDIVDYKVFDYNNDKRDDIILLKRDNYIELLENKNTDKNFVSHWNLVQIYDLWSIIETWDFTWDGFDDIFFSWQDWKAYLLNNVSKDFSRFDLTNKLNLESKISSAWVFDMDNDWKSDIVILEEDWDLNIFYWWWNPSNPSFTRKNIDSWLWLSLWNFLRKDNWLIYFKGLYQPNYSNSSINLNPNDTTNWIPRDVDSQVIDSEIYVSLPYSKNNTSWNIESLDKEVEQTYFLKSEYLSSLWISYEKRFIDRNKWVLASWDTVDVEIKIKNNSWKTLRELTYLENFEKYFQVDTNTIKNSKNISISSGLWVSWFSLQKFSLEPNEEIIINYSSISKKLTHINLRLWLFEKWESWDDLYWDILLDDVNLSCKDFISIYRSLSSKSYEKSNTSEKCDVSKLPEDIAKLSKDENNNKIPDYIEDLKDNKNKLLDYSKSELNSMYSDKDNDWISDDNDNFDNLSWISNLESGLDKAQNLLNWLSCWFNNWACISTPLNWAPLAPWSDPTFMWTPIWDWLNVDEWLPVFSALTYATYWTFCWPSVWPISPFWEWCSVPWAWWVLWINSKSNFVRIFVTPTLTWWVWTAICFGWPASVYWYKSMMPGLAPLFPGWNCVVMAKPILWCSNDWSQWDPSSVWTPDNFSNYSIINWSWRNGTCSIKTWTTINKDYVWSYLKSNWWKTDKKLLWIWVFKDAVENHNKYDGSPLFTIWWWEWVSVDLSLSNSHDSTDFSDVEKIQEKRIKAFPEFLMDWVVRQIDEIVSKLTDFPTIFIVLPDFSWIFDSNKSWWDNWSDYQLIDNSKINTSLLWTNNTWLKDKVTQVNSWVREAYEFISTLPLINLREESVNINVPWISKVELDRALISWDETLKQWQSELDRFNSLENLDAEFKNKVNVEVNWLIWSLIQNKKVIEDYLNIPEKLEKLINKKQDYLEQILCNVEIVSDIMWSWIWKNGERFKAWVELYILIKAILKSWQTFIDIFVEYEEECKQCKNERHDTLNWQFKIISMIVPDIPIVEFPRWPDIVLDLHNIRASLDVAIPSFEVNTRPINLPNLPSISLPSVPNLNVWLNLPDLPILPKLEIPELPDLPSLPNIELPNLPPPPKLPKLFEWFDFILNIWKLVTKAMCILKSSPFHPEWRAWDQISFLTERNWFMWIDFLNKSLPKFSISSISSINVTSYVNLELETDFIVELARQLVQPINNFTSDFSNIFNLSVDDIDLSNTIPSDINADVNVTSYNKDFLGRAVLANFVVNNINKWLEWLEKDKNIEVSNKEFISWVLSSLSKQELTSDLRLDEVRNIWNDVSNYSFSSENNIIDWLKSFNEEKYSTLKDIINTEKSITKDMLKDFRDVYSSWRIKVSSNKTNINLYKDSINKYNIKTFENIWKMFDTKNSDKEVLEIKQMWEELNLKIKNNFWWNFDKDSEKSILKDYSNRLLANTNVNNTPVISHNNSWTCWVPNNSWYSYNYSWIYVLEKSKSYRLFDYIDEIKWDEYTKQIDFDLDSDDDLLYFVNNTLYLKENLEKKSSKKVYLKQKPIVLNSEDNKFLKSNFIESVNNVYESDISNSMINISFSSLQDIYNYRLSYFDIVDKYLSQEKEEIISTKNKNIVDWIANSDEITKKEETDLFIKRKDLAYIDKIWHFRWLEINTTKLKSIREDLINWKTVTISSNTKLYSWPNYLDFNYKVDLSSDKVYNMKLEPNSNIEAKNDIIIIWISRWDWFVETSEKVIYNWDQLSKIKWFPLSFDTKIKFIWDKSDLRPESYVDIIYYDNSELHIDFNKNNSWSLYNLWSKSNDYLFSLSMKNDYYYSKINWFKNNIVWTSTSQILLSPQLKADKNTPDISLNSIKVPIYKELEIDITNKLIEDSWFSWISKVFIDYFLETDTNWDLNTKNDDDSMPSLRVFKKWDSIFLKAGKYSNLVKKKIWINVIDENWNLWFKEIDFEVYSPIPEIESYNWVLISWRISEDIDSEPINFYRFRWWSLSKLWDEKDTFTVYTNDKWEFSLKTWLFEWWLSIKDKSWKEIASISEKTWKISISSQNSLKYNILASLSKETNYPEIFIKNNSWENIFKQTLRVNWNSKVIILDDFNNLKDSWIYAKLYDSNFWFYILPENIINNAWVFVLYKSDDKDKKAFLKVYPDWRIEIPNNYSLQYSEFRNYIVLKIYDNNKKLFLDVLYKIDADYVIN